MTHADHSPAPLSWRRLAGASTVVALVACLLAAASGTAAAIVTGRLADHPGWPGFALLAACAVAALGLQTGAAVAISGVVGRAEGRLRADLLGVALREPLPVLQEQGVGELVDRLDDDPAQLATLARGPAWWTVSSLMVALLACSWPG